MRRRLPQHVIWSERGLLAARSGRATPTSRVRDAHTAIRSNRVKAWPRLIFLFSNFIVSSCFHLGNMRWTHGHHLRAPRLMWMVLIQLGYGGISTRNQRKKDRSNPCPNPDPIMAAP